MHIRCPSRANKSAVFASKSVNHKSYWELHRSVYHFILYIKLKPIVRWVDVASCSIIVPFGEELAWTKATETVVGFGEGGERKTGGESIGAKAGIAADIGLREAVIICRSNAVVWAGAGVLGAIGIEGTVVIRNRCSSGESEKARDREEREEMHYCKVMQKNRREGLA